MPKQKVLKRVVVKVPETMEEVAAFLAEISAAQRAASAIQDQLNEQVGALQQQAVSEAQPHHDRVKELLGGVFIYAEAHRDDLTASGKKTVEVPTGIFGWRFTPPSVSLRNIKAVIEALKKLKLGRFIRVKEEVDKQAMLGEPEVAKKVRGVSVVQREEFFIKPNELEVEVSSEVGALKKRVAH